MEKCVLCEKETDKLIFFCGVPICSECIAEETVICDQCNKRIWKEDVFGDDLTHLCDECYEHYTHCFCCRKLIHINNAYYKEIDMQLQDFPYCKECYEKL